MFVKIRFDPIIDFITMKAPFTPHFFSWDGAFVRKLMYISSILLEILCKFINIHRFIVHEKSL